MPPEDPCLKLYDKVLDLATQFIEKRSSLLRDPLNLYKRAYLVNPGGDLAEKGTYIGHGKFVQGAQTGLKNAVEDAEATGCEIPEVIKNLLNQNVLRQPLP